MSFVHVVSISGGKDSTACYLRAIERGRPFRAVFADTGNEHPYTLDYVRELHLKAGGPEVEWVSADYSGEFERRRQFIAEKWPLQGIPAERIERAIAAMRPTGNPFLDVCLLKGIFPATKIRKFCTEELKLEPMNRGVKHALLNAGTSVVEWIGERAQESARRALKPMLELIPVRFEHGGNMARLPRRRWRILYRPILYWPVEDVFAIHRRHGVEPNPLYRMGMKRVGCMPCINAGKDEIREIAARFPEHIDRIREWEAVVAEGRKQGETLPTFFAAGKIPLRQDGRRDVDAVVEWASTGRGGRQFDFFRNGEDFDECASAFGLCDAGDLDGGKRFAELLERGRR